MIELSEDARNRAAVAALGGACVFRIFDAAGAELVQVSAPSWSAPTGGQVALSHGVANKAHATGRAVRFELQAVDGSVIARGSIEDLRFPVDDDGTVQIIATQRVGIDSFALRAFSQ